MFYTKYVYVDNVNEFKNHLNYCRNKKVILQRERQSSDGASIANLVIGRTTVSLTYRNKEYKTYTYIFRLDGLENNQYITGGEAWSILNRYYKVPNLRDNPLYGFQELDDDRYIWNKLGISKAILYFNEKMSGKRYNNVYGYDLNSAFSYAMLQPMPDTSVEPEIDTLVNENHIGFREVYRDEEVSYEAVFRGRADFVFPLIESPFKRFVEKWYNKKRLAQDKKEKCKAKGVLNYSIGYLQKYNPFLRAAIITYSNEIMRKLIDENTLYCNTDSIVSKVRRLDIEKNLGTEIGQWKIEHTGDFAYIGYTYQWNDSVPSARGVSKEWFKAGFDLIKDEMPSEGNLWYIDTNTFELKEVVYGEEKKE